jgi:iron complex transport system substrate-binding protein
VNTTIERFRTGRDLPSLPEVDDATRREFLIGAAALLLLPAGCTDGGEGAGEAASAQTRTVRHAMGETEVPARPRRVAALHDTMVAYPMLDLGFEPIASAGVEGEIRAGDNDTSELEFLGQVTGPNVERMAALQPDLIVGLESASAGQYEELSRIAPTVLLDPEAPLFDHRRRLAELVNRLPEYEELVSRVDRRTEELKGRLEPLLPELEVSALSAVGVDQIFTYYGPSIPYSVAFERLGLRFSKDMPPSYDAVEEFFSLERLPDFDADVIFLMSNISTEDAVDELRERPIFGSLNAAEKDQVFAVSYDEWTYARVPGILSVYDDVERYLLDREIDASGDFR